jgi:hypothetical protein
LAQQAQAKTGVVVAGPVVVTGWGRKRLGTETVSRMEAATAQRRWWIVTAGRDLLDGHRTSMQSPNPRRRLDDPLWGIIVRHIRRYRDGPTADRPYLSGRLLEAFRIPAMFTYSPTVNLFGKERAQRDGRYRPAGRSTVTS